MPAARAFLVLMALTLCALQLPLLATVDMPGMAMAATSTDVEMSQADHGDAPACCVFDASPVSPRLISSLVLTTFVLVGLLTWARRTPLAATSPRDPVPTPGSRGRPILHAYLN